MTFSARTWYRLCTQGDGSQTSGLSPALSYLKLLCLLYGDTWVSQHCTIVWQQSFLAFAAVGFTHVRYFNVTSKELSAGLATCFANSHSRGQYSVLAPFVRCKEQVQHSSDSAKSLTTTTYYGGSTTSQTSFSCYCSSVSAARLQVRAS